MITNLQIGNFKALQNVELRELAPLTIILGPNDSGKSSILHAILLLRYFLKKQRFVVGWL